MIVTEKQIKWAEQIKANTLKAFDKYLQDFTEKYANHPNKEGVQKRFEAQKEIKDKLTAINDAVWWINNRDETPAGFINLKEVYFK